ncbi:MAG: hypothetical protein CBR30_07795 [Dictyoglomus sp. NZ13-RE01]|nr:MAG: hypothetical protein CBR30_07795 [Dictyoglomus sp. NZ13-RE01]
MGLIYQPWFMPILLTFLLIWSRRLEKREEIAYKEDASKFVSVEGRPVEGKKEIVPPWRKEEEKKKEEKKKPSFGFWVLNFVVIIYIIFVWYLVTYAGFSKTIYEILCGFAFGFYFFNFNIPSLLSNIWTFREYPGGVKGEITLSKHFVLAARKIESKIFLYTFVILFISTLSWFVFGILLSLIIRTWLIERYMSRTPLPDW